MSGLEFRGMLRALKFTGFLLINLVVAIIGTAILEAAAGRAIPSHSIAAAIWNEYLFSAICPTLTGFGMWRTWRNSAAKWTWVLAAAWFAFGLLAIAGHDDVFGEVTGFVSGNNLGAAEMRSFFAFTVPLIRAVFYSVGAYLSSLLYRAPVTSRS
jgi:hypothetical protein